MRLERVTVKNVKLVEKDGIYFLEADKVIFFRKNHEKIIRHLKFQLVEVTTRMLTEYRKDKVPSFVLKIGERLYFSRILSICSFPQVRARAEDISIKSWLSIHR